MLGATGGYAFTFDGLNDKNAKLTPTLEVLGDVAGANDGVTIEPQLNYAQRLSDRWQVALRGFATWARKITSATTSAWTELNRGQVACRSTTPIAAFSR